MLGSPLDSAPEEDERLKGIVVRAHERQLSRQGTLNSDLSARQLREHLEIRPEALSLLEKASTKMGLTARGFVRMMRVAATISDIEESSAILPVHIAEALGFRALASIERYLSGTSEISMNG